MITITFVVGGRRIPGEALEREPFADAVDRVMLRALRNRLERQTASIRCAQHDEPLRVVAIGPTPEELTLSVEACCGQMKTIADEALDPRRRLGR